MAVQDLMGRALAALSDLDGPLPIEVIQRLAGTDGDVQAPLTIAEASELLDVSPHTLRYYERAGLVDVGRDASGYRLYSAEAVRRLVFLTRMRLSGMAMRDLQHYVALVEAGDELIMEKVGPGGTRRPTFSMINSPVGRPTRQLRPPAGGVHPRE